MMDANIDIISHNFKLNFDHSDMSQNSKSTDNKDKETSHKIDEIVQQNFIDLPEPPLEINKNSQEEGSTNKGVSQTVEENKPKKQKRLKKIGNEAVSNIASLEFINELKNKSNLYSTEDNDTKDDLNDYAYSKSQQKKQKKIKNISNSLAIPVVKMTNKFFNTNEANSTIKLDEQDLSASLLSECKENELIFEKKSGIAKPNFGCGNGNGKLQNFNKNIELDQIKNAESPKSNENIYLLKKNSVEFNSFLQKALSISQGTDRSISNKNLDLEIEIDSAPTLARATSSSITQGTEYLKKLANTKTIIDKNSFFSSFSQPGSGEKPKNSEQVKKELIRQMRQKKSTNLNLDNLMKCFKTVDFHEFDNATPTTTTTNTPSQSVLKKDNSQSKKIDEIDIQTIKELEGELSDEGADAEGEEEIENDGDCSDEQYEGSFGKNDETKEDVEKLLKTMLESVPNEQKEEKKSKLKKLSIAIEEFKVKKALEKELKKKESAIDPNQLKLIRKQLFDDEAQLGSDHEENDDVVKEIDKAEYEDDKEDLDKDLEELIDRTEYIEGDEKEAYKKFLKDQQQAEKDQIQKLMMNKYLRRAKEDNDFEDDERRKKIKRYEAMENLLLFHNEEDNSRDIEEKNSSNKEEIFGESEAIAEEKKLQIWKVQKDMKKMLENARHTTGVSQAESLLDSILGEEGKIIKKTYKPGEKIERKPPQNLHLSAKLASEKKIMKNNNSLLQMKKENSKSFNVFSQKSNLSNSNTAPFILDEKLNSNSNSMSHTFMKANSKQGTMQKKPVYNNSVMSLVTNGTKKTPIKTPFFQKNIKTLQNSR